MVNSASIKIGLWGMCSNSDYYRSLDSSLCCHPDTGYGITEMPRFNDTGEPRYLDANAQRWYVFLIVKGNLIIKVTHSQSLMRQVTLVKTVDNFQN